MPALRRSNRLNTVDSNGREYLADLICWPRSKLEAWVCSHTVRPHMLLWHHLCIASRRRFNDAVEWINTGPRGYFYGKENLEEDLLLMCLCEGGEESEGDGVQSDDGVAAYANEDAKTGKWVTQELWARTAWRIVQANRGEGQLFKGTVVKHPAACYAFVIDMLCIAFHSIAFRGRASCWEWLINGESFESGGKLALEDIIHTADDDERTETSSSISDLTSSTETSDDSEDLDFELSNRRKSKGTLLLAKTVGEIGEQDSRSGQLVEDWIAGLETPGHASVAPALRSL